MKRISILVIAVALVTTLAQCKKTETPTNDNEGAKVHITLDVNSNSRVIISPETGGTAFEHGDKVLVANNGHYVGTLTYNRSQRKFEGDLDEGLSEDDYLHFYLLGNKDTEENLNDTLNRPTTLTVNISDQTASYPEIAYAHSTVKYTDGVTAYTARLLNKCALVKFTTDNIPTTVAVTITGMNNKVLVNLGSNSFSYSKVGDGIISLHAESKTARWGILLPQGAVDDVVASAEGYVTTPAFTVPQHGENDYLNEGIALELVESYPVGAINGKYTINAEGGQVYFSKGNLQYVGTSWQFATNQYDILGNPQSSDRTDYFGYNSYTCPEGWRNMSQTEWAFVITNRSVSNTLSDGARFTLATIGGSYKGMVLFPDNYTHPDETGFVAGTYNAASNYTATVSLEGWALMEAAGCVFLPAAGWLNGSSINDIDYGCYNSTTHPEGYGTRYYDPMFGSGSIDMTATSFNSTGTSVRLVWEL